MANIESNFRNMVLTLFGVTFLSSAALGVVYQVTKKPIEDAALNKKIQAIKEVVPEFTNNPIEESYTISSDVGDLMCYPAKNNQKLVGVAIQTLTNQGFGGEVKIMVGLLPDGTIFDTAVLSHKETPGLGDKMNKKKSTFSEQFKMKNPKSFKLKVKKDGGDVDAITAATISSRAFCDAIKRAYNAFVQKQ